MRIRPLLSCLVPALLLAAVPVAAQTQTGPGSPTLPISAEVLLAASKGGAAELAALRRYFDEATSPEDVVDRFGQLVSPLDGPTLVAVVDLVVDQARAVLSASRVMRFVADPSYVPKRTLVALDFGASGAPSAPGFERVSPSDPRLTGGTASQVVDSASGIQGDGLSGLQRIKLKVPGDETTPFRILIATRDVPNAAFPNSNFGPQIKVNGRISEIRNRATDQRIGLALLGEPHDGESNPLPEGETLRTARFSESELAEAVRQGGGAIVIETYAANGEIDIELPPDARTFLTALIVERADQPSEFVLSMEARDAVVTLQTRITLEEQIQIMIASLLEKVEPAVGEPVFPPELTASPS